MTEWHTLHSVTQAKEWLMIQWRSNTFPATDTVSTGITFFNKMAGPKVGSEDPMSYLSRDNLPSRPLSPKCILKENLAVGDFTSSLLYLFTLSFVCSWNSLWLSFYIAGFSWSHSIVGLWLYFSSVSVSPRELVFLFHRINKCFPQRKSGNIWPF